MICRVVSHPQIQIWYAYCAFPSCKWGYETRSQTIRSWRLAFDMAFRHAVHHAQYPFEVVK